LDCTIGDGCQGQFQQAYANLIGCGGIALESDSPYRAADGGQDLCRPARRYSAMAHGRGGELSVHHGPIVTNPRQQELLQESGRTSANMVSFCRVHLTGPP
jgi:hypothetical protein